jgi:Transcriptional regulator
MGRRQETAAATRAKLLAAARACFDTLGYERATIRDIAASAGMSTGAFFWHWTGKAEIYAGVYGHYPLSPEQGQELLTALKGGPVPAWARPLIQQTQADA